MLSLLQKSLRVAEEQLLEHKTPTVHEYKDCRYINYKDIGVSLQVVDGVVDQITVYNQGQDGFEQYPLPIQLPNKKTPLTIHLASTIGKDIVQALGEPKRKGGGSRDRMPVWMEYDLVQGDATYGIMIELCSFDWEEASTKVRSVMMYKQK